MLDRPIAAEREACAKIAEGEEVMAESNQWWEYRRSAHNIAVRIRMRDRQPR